MVGLVFASLSDLDGVARQEHQLLMATRRLRPRWLSSAPSASLAARMRVRARPRHVPRADRAPCSAAPLPRPRRQGRHQERIGTRLARLEAAAGRD